MRRIWFKAKNMAEKTTYTKDELAEFRQLILDKIESAQDDLDVLRAATANDSDNGTEDTSPTFNLLTAKARIGSNSSALNFVSPVCKLVITPPFSFDISSSETCSAAFTNEIEPRLNYLKHVSLILQTVLDLL